MFRSGTRIGWGHPLHDHGPDPDEYFARVSATTGGSPEKRLRLAVLLNAITHLRRGAQDADEAARWVRGELEGVDQSFSFSAICETLDLDPTHLARALLRPMENDAPLPRRQVRTQRLHGMPRHYRRRTRPERRKAAS